jgi:hypothetical protein
MTRKLLIAILAIGVLTIMGIVLFMWWTTPQSGNALPSTLPAATSSPSLFPSGNTRTPITPVSGNNQTPTLNTNPAAGTSVSSEGSSNLNSPLYQISTKPVSGLFVAGTGATSSLVYVEKATGHLYQVAPASRLPTRISNTTFFLFSWLGIFGLGFYFRQLTGITFNVLQCVGNFKSGATSVNAIANKMEQIREKFGLN